MARAGEAALKFGTTDETFGYFESLESGEAVEMAKVAAGNGDIKAVEFFGKETNVRGKYVWRTDTGSPAAAVGAGTTVTLTDAELGAAIYIQSATKAKSQGGFMSVDFEGWLWSALGS
jgi:hypothetical protein